jgi:cytochrome c-type biogenesis protein
MLALLGALVAGVLTTLAPCVLPLLPVIVGGSVAGVAGEPAAALAGGGVAVSTRRRTSLATRRAVIITGSLGASIVAFTLLLKASTVLIDVPVEVWSAISGGLLIALGLVSLFPSLWERASSALSLPARSGRQLSAAQQRGGLVGAVLTGVALGPVFTSCSPLYGYVVVTVIPSDLAYGLALLAAYVIGLCGTLLLIALLGQRLVRNAGWLADPHGWVRRGLGLVFVLIGVIVLMGWDRDLQAWILDHSPIAPWELDSGFIPD